MVQRFKKSRSKITEPVPISHFYFVNNSSNNGEGEQTITKKKKKCVIPFTPTRSSTKACFFKEILSSPEDDTLVEMLGGIVDIMLNIAIVKQHLIMTERDTNTLASGNSHLLAMEGLMANTRSKSGIERFEMRWCEVRSIFRHINLGDMGSSTIRDEFRYILGVQDAEVLIGVLGDDASGE